MTTANSHLPPTSTNPFTVRPVLRPFITAITLTVLGPLFLALCFADYLAGLTADVRVVWVAGLAGTLILLLNWVLTSSRLLLGLLVSFWGGLALLHISDFTARKPFRRFYYSLSPGQTQEQVLGLLDSYYPPGRSFPRPSVEVGETSMGIVLDPANSHYNSEGITVKFEHGLLKSKEYSWD
jgi:hypothetical protein